MVHTPYSLGGLRVARCRSRGVDAARWRNPEPNEMAAARGRCAHQRRPMTQIDCPECRQSVEPVPIVFGYPAPETFEAAERGGRRLKDYGFDVDAYLQAMAREATPNA